MSTQQLTEAVSLKRDYYHLIINGEKVESSTGQTIKTYNPATGELVAEVAKASKEDTEKAVQAARQAFDHGKWRKYPINRLQIKVLVSPAFPRKNLGVDAHPE